MAGADDTQAQDGNEVAEAIDDAEVPLASTTDDAASSSGNARLWITIVIVAVVAAGLIIFFVNRKKKDQRHKLLWLRQGGDSYLHPVYLMLEGNSG